MRKHQHFLRLSFPVFWKQISSFGRIEGFLTLVVLLFASFSVRAANGSFGGGSGSPSNPYIIEDAADLDAVRNYLSAHYRLANDIDLTAYLAPGGAGYAKWGTDGWEPIGATLSQFTGTFNGGGYKIIGIWIYRPTTNYVGLFGFLGNARIDSLGIDIAANKSIEGQQYVSGLVSYPGGGGMYTASQITNCYVSGTVEGISFVGGLVAFNYYSHIVNCYSTGNVIGNGGMRIGGLVGEQQNGTITNSYSSSNVNAYNSLRVGGLVGNAIGVGNTISNCYATGDVNVISGFEDAYVGGLVGFMSYTNLTNCYATGNVTTNVQRAGGLIGMVTIAPYVLKNCYAMGKVEGWDIVGGLIGEEANGNSLYDNYPNFQNCVAANDTIVVINPSSYRINRVIGDYYGTSPNISNLYANSNMVVIIDQNVVSVSNDRYLNGIGQNLSTLKSLAFYNTGSNWANNTIWSINPPSGIWNICDGECLPFLRWQGIICKLVTDTIFASATTNGTISPSGAVVVEKGSNQTFTFAGTNCYEIDSLWIDGVYYPDSIAYGRYTFINVNGNHTIKVSFKQIEYMTVISYTTCSNEPYQFGGKLLTISGVYYDTLQNSYGCNSVIELTLTVNPATITNYSASFYERNIYNDNNFTSLTKAGTYFVTYQTVLGCDSVVCLTLTYKPTTELCMVSVDNNNRNVLVWKRTGVVASYNIYREGTQRDKYSLIANVPYSNLNTWTDPTSDATTRSYRYKISSVDALGNESNLSELHKSIHLTVSTSNNKGWNLIWSEYEGREFLSYSLYRSQGNGNGQQWLLVATIPSGNYTYSDHNTPNGSSAHYMIEIVLDVPCVLSKSLSSIKSNIASTKVEGEQSVFAVYPNPTNGPFTIENGESNIENIEIYDVVGKLQKFEIGKSEIGNTTIDISNLAAGVYFMKIDGKPVKIIKN